MIGTDVQRAAASLRAGGLVALPTETVYGLAADATNAAAVARIFTIKGRPADHPLIVHLASVDEIDEWAERIPAWARLLAAAYWPGPLTLILPKRPHVLSDVTGGQDTVGLRVPAHALTREVLRLLGTGVAAPSANRFGRVSPTTIEHVQADIGDLLGEGDYLLDGGPCLVGVESTIVDCTGDAPRLLRAGAVTVAMIAETTGLDVLGTDGRIRASGTLASHYAPAATVHIVRADELGRFPGAGLIAPASVPTPPGMTRLLEAEDAGAYARGLYAALRASDAAGLSDVCAVMPDDEGLGAAVRDRLARAAH
jgi:L-threonylcarbamoyladenylate synthase